MKILNDNLWLCSDCMQVAVNGLQGIDLLDPEATIAGVNALGPNLVPNFDITGEGIREFSNVECAACKTSLAGYRARFATLMEEK